MSNPALDHATSMERMKARAPDIGRAFGPFFQGLMKEGALAVKHKELIAVGISVAVRCEACIEAHVSKAIKAGASGAEIMEATGVAVLMGGGPAYTYAAAVSDALERAGVHG